jgi:hypothetical protein
MTDNGHSRVAVLGTLAEFHREPIPYDMSALLNLVAEINPDLLCLDIPRKQWKERNFENLVPEYQEVLLPLAQQTDIVVAPIGGENLLIGPESTGWRGGAINWLRNRIAMIQRTAPGADAINQGWRHHLATFLYDLTRRLARGDLEHATRQHTDHLVHEIVEVAQRDPGRRVLAVVNVQHCHIIRKKLRAYDDLDIVTHSEL